MGGVGGGLGGGDGEGGRGLGGGLGGCGGGGAAVRGRGIQCQHVASDASDAAVYQQQRCATTVSQEIVITQTAIVRGGLLGGRLVQRAAG